MKRTNTKLDFLKMISEQDQNFSLSVEGFFRKASNVIKDSETHSVMEFSANCSSWYNYTTLVYE
jgi:hypothetical protein